MNKTACERNFFSSYMTSFSTLQDRYSLHKVYFESLIDQHSTYRDLLSRIKVQEVISTNHWHIRWNTSGTDLLKITECDEGLCQCNSSRMMSLLNDIRTTWNSRLRLDCKQGAVIVPNVRSPVSVISYFSSVLFFFYQLFINDLNIPARLKHSGTTLTFRYDINFPARL